MATNNTEALETVQLDGLVNLRNNRKKTGKDTNKTFINRSF